VNSREIEVSDAMELLSQAIRSLRHDASVQLLTGIIQAFEIEHVNLHDFLQATSNVIYHKAASLICGQNSYCARRLKYKKFDATADPGVATTISQPSEPM
jgi:hypothetical protein